MVQFIPQAQGATSFKTPAAAQIMTGVGDVLGGGGQMMGAGGTAANPAGLAALIAAMQNRQSMAQRFNVPSVPSATPGAAPTNPLGPLANMPVNRVQQLHEMVGVPGIAQLLGQQSMQTLYYNPITKTASLTPEDGSIPIGGFKGPAALQGMNSTNANAWRQNYDMIRLSLQERMQKLHESTSLTPEQKLQLAVMSGQSRVLGNPLIDLPQPEYEAMLSSMQAIMSDLEKQLKITPQTTATTPSAPAPGTTPPGAGTKGAEVERKVGNKIAIFDSKTKKFIRWK